METVADVLSPPKRIDNVARRPAGFFFCQHTPLHSASCQNLFTLPQWLRYFLFLQNVLIVSWACVSFFGAGMVQIFWKRLLTSLTEAFGRMIFGAGFVHGDPHPGNIFIMDGGQVALIDCGQVTRLTLLGVLGKRLREAESKLEWVCCCLLVLALVVLLLILFLFFCCFRALHI